jgi:hypothetical protein
MPIPPDNMKPCPRCGKPSAGGDKPELCSDCCSEERAIDDACLDNHCPECGEYERECECS